MGYSRSVFVQRPMSLPGPARGRNLQLSSYKRSCKIAAGDGIKGLRNRTLGGCGIGEGTDAQANPHQEVLQSLSRVFKEEKRKWEVKELSFLEV